MCGLPGFAGSFRGGEEDEALLESMEAAILHRGPDDAGVRLMDGVGLASSRLSILDLSKHGRMPMGTPDGRFCITYNCEVYNFREIRRDLESRGERFASGTDTEVVLRLYAVHGSAMLSLRASGPCSWRAIDLG